MTLEILTLLRSLWVVCFSLLLNPCCLGVGTGEVPQKMPGKVAGESLVPASWGHRCVWRALGGGGGVAGKKGGEVQPQNLLSLPESSSWPEACGWVGSEVGHPVVGGPRMSEAYVIITVACAVERASKVE